MQGPDASQIIERLQKEGIEQLYHFTSVENLAGIASAQALCSKQVLESAGRWPPPEPGGNELSHNLDRSIGNWDKVSFNLTPSTPMAYRFRQRAHACYCLVPASIAGRGGVVFTNANAAGFEQVRGEGVQGVDLVNFDMVRSNPRPWDREGWFRDVQAEILIPSRVPISEIREIAFVSEASRQEGERIWGRHPHPPFTVRPQHFADYPKVTPPSFSFSYLSSADLTDDEITKANFNSPHRPISTIRRRPNRIAYLIARLKVLTGTVGTVRWSPSDQMSREEFATSDEYTWWPSVDLDRLPLGRNWADIWLNEVRWRRVDFEVLP